MALHLNFLLISAFDSCIRNSPDATVKLLTYEYKKTLTASFHKGRENPTKILILATSFQHNFLDNTLASS